MAAQLRAGRRPTTVSVLSAAAVGAPRETGLVAELAM
jgi:hypothetical protein